MPVTIEFPAAALDRPAGERRARPGVMRDRGRRLCIGFVNNMPDSAFAATETQFLRLLEFILGLIPWITTRLRLRMEVTTLCLQIISRKILNLNLLPRPCPPFRRRMKKNLQRSRRPALIFRPTI